MLVGQVKAVDLAGCGFLPTPSKNPALASATDSGGATLATSATEGSTKVKGTGKDSSTAAGGRDKTAGTAGAAAAAAQGASAADGFSPKDANGVYVLDLAVPSERQVAVELLKLAEKHGVDTWREATLNRKTFSIKGVSGRGVASQQLWVLKAVMSVLAPAVLFPNVTFSCGSNGGFLDLFTRLEAKVGLLYQFEALLGYLLPTESTDLLGKRY